MNLPGGRELYHEETFTANNLHLSFVNTMIAEYSQFGHDFVPGLSIIDIMMFNSPFDIQQHLLG